LEGIRKEGTSSNLPGVTDENQNNLEGSAIAQAVNRRLPAAAVWVRAQFRYCGICGEQSSTVPGFSMSTSVSPANSHSTDWSTLIVIYHPRLVQYTEQWPTDQVDSVSPLPKKLRERRKKNLNQKSQCS
jgi:hypothetical protein